MNKNLAFLCLSLVIGLIIFASFSFAAPAPDCVTYCSAPQTYEQPANTVCYCNPIAAGSFEEILGTITNFLFTLAIVVAPLMIIYAGFLFVTAAGNSDQITKARNLILWTVVGVGIIMFSRVLASLIQSIFGIV